MEALRAFIGALNSAIAPCFWNLEGEHHPPPPAMALVIMTDQ